MDLQATVQAAVKAAMAQSSQEIQDLQAKLAAKDEVITQLAQKVTNLEVSGGSKAKPRKSAPVQPSSKTAPTPIKSC